MKLKLSQLITNDDGKLSTTSTIQIMSAITLLFGFLYALFTKSIYTVDLALIASAMATLTATSKGFVSNKKRESNHLVSTNENQDG